MATTVLDNVKNEMLEGFAEAIQVKLRFQDGSESDFILIDWNYPPTAGQLIQTDGTKVEFPIETNMGANPKQVTAFNIYTVGGSGELMLNYQLPNIYSYPNNGTFAIQGMIVEIS